jgi:signal transduction histidine kinase
MAGGVSGQRRSVPDERPLARSCPIFALYRTARTEVFWKETCNTVRCQPFTDINAAPGCCERRDPQPDRNILAGNGDMDKNNPPKDSNTFLSIIPAQPIAKRRALAIIILLFALFGIIVPFARVTLPRIESFIPIFDSIIALNNLVTAGLLFVGFSRSGLRAVLLLAGGYLFTAVMAAAHLAASPGLVASSDLVGASAQTGAWLDIFRNAGFPLFVICYALLKRHDTTGAQSRADPRICIISVTLGTVAGASLLFFLATGGHTLLPQIVHADDHTSAMLVVNVPVLLSNLTALIFLMSWFPYSIVDLWLLVVIFTYIPGIALSTIINAGRLDLGYATGHLFAAVAASIVLVVILFEASRLTGRLDAAIEVAEERNAQLAASHEELAQAQRLEAIGQLTGGVAHDFNNLLTVITGNLELIKRADGDAKKIERLAQAAMEAAQRGGHLVSQLLTYARKQISRPQIINLNQLIVNVEHLMHRVIGEQIEVVTTLSPVLAPVRVDPAQFESAILNLAINSRDAMAGGGRMTIETANAIVDQYHAANNPEISPGRYVVITVRDTGTGMTPGVLARAFDPFFTTKEVGKGSGLGLSQAYGFAKTAGGHVKIDSELGVGTTVRLYLPQSADRITFSEPEAETASMQPASGRGTILIVEDDQEVLAVTAENLRKLGYQVVTAGNAGQALEILAADQPIDLLFSDVVMPGGVNGAQLAARARHVRPDLKVLLTSGYPAAALSLEHGLPDNLDIVGKPYQRDELATKLKLVIGA